MEQEFKYCPICELDKPINKFYLFPDGSIRRHVCKSCNGKKDRARKKLELLRIFGDKCQCCGETNPYFLTLDHVNNDGAADRLLLNEQQIYAKAKTNNWNKELYQMLCMNCNFAKGHFGVCPHQNGMTTEKVLEKLNKQDFKTGKTLQNNIGNKGLALGPKVQHERALERNQGYESHKEMLRDEKRNEKALAKIKALATELGVSPEEMLKKMLPPNKLSGLCKWGSQQRDQIAPSGPLL